MIPHFIHSSKNRHVWSRGNVISGWFSVYTFWNVIPMHFFKLKVICYFLNGSRSTRAPFEGNPVSLDSSPRLKLISTSIPNFDTSILVCILPVFKNNSLPHDCWTRIFKNNYTLNEIKMCVSLFNLSLIFVWDCIML